MLFGSEIKMSLEERCIHFLSVAGINGMAKGNSWRKGFLSSPTSQSITEKSERLQSGKDPGGRHWNRDHRVGILTALLLKSRSACFLYNQGSPAKSDITSNALGSPTSITNQSRKCPQSCPRANPMEAFSQLSSFPWWFQSLPSWPKPSRTIGQSAFQPIQFSRSLGTGVAS